jgi:tRNA(Ile2) C34 agmatinyltransferase TiaS
MVGFKEYSKSLANGNVAKMIEYIVSPYTGEELQVKPISFKVRKCIDCGKLIPRNGGKARLRCRKCNMKHRHEANRK